MSLIAPPMIQRTRLVVPREHLGTLVEPGAEQIRAALAEGPRDSFDNTLILDRPLSEWRQRLRRRLRLDGPVIVTGHQAEFFHAGVFAKVIAAHTLATRDGGSAVFLVVDSDLPKSPRLIVPQITPSGLRRVEVEIPGCDVRRPVECHPALPRQEWLDFFVRIASIHEHYGVSLLRRFADAWLTEDDPAVDTCDAMICGWTAVEESLGLYGIRHQRISELCAGPEFRAFAAHLILHAPRLAESYNAAAAAYRQRHHVRGTSRPVPPLATSAARNEVPLWVFRDDGPRQRLHVAHRDTHVDLYADGQLIAEVPRDDLADAERAGTSWELERTGWRLRPRALALSAFARLFIADLFIHGIGGMKYEEVTDGYVRELFALEPPPICCVSATVRLPLPRMGVRRRDVLAANRANRDFKFNPQRHIADAPDDLLKRRDDKIRRSNELRRHQPHNHADRRMVFDGIRRLNEHIRACRPWQAAELEQQAEAAARSYALDRIALDREYFTALHLKRTLAALVRHMRKHLNAD